jgi:hypothetical protein
MEKELQSSSRDIMLFLFNHSVVDFILKYVTPGCARGDVVEPCCGSGYSLS